MGKKLRPIDILKCLKEKSITVDEIKNRKDYDRIIKLALREGILTQNDLIKDEVSNLSFEEFSNGQIYSVDSFIAKSLHDELKEYVDDAIQENGFSGDYNDLENKPCYEYDDYVKYDFDGNKEGKETTGYLVHVTDELSSITEDQFYNSLFEQMASGEVESGEISSIGSKEDILSMFMIIDTQEGKAYVQPELFCIIPHDNFTCTYNGIDITFTKKGLWFFRISTDIYFKSLSVPVKKVKQLDEKFIPDSIKNGPYHRGVVISAEEIIAHHDDEANIAIITVDNFPLDTQCTYYINYAGEVVKGYVYYNEYDGKSMVSEWVPSDVVQISIYENKEDPTKTDIELYEARSSTTVIAGTTGNLIINAVKNTLGSYHYPDDFDIFNSLTIGSRGRGYGEHIYDNTDIGEHSIASGNSIASGDCSVAIGKENIATGWVSYAQGISTESHGKGSHAEGQWTIANADCSHAEGYNTIASGEDQHVQGRYNIEDTKNEFAHIVGNGDDDDDRKNIHTLDWGGNAWFYGKVSVSEGPDEKFDLTTKQYVDENILAAYEKALNIIVDLEDTVKKLEEESNARDCVVLIDRSTTFKYELFINNGELKTNVIPKVNNIVLGKTNYVDGEGVDFTGTKIEYMFPDGSIELKDVEDFSLLSSNKTHVSLEDTSIDVTYDGHTFTVGITVSEFVITDILIDFDYTENADGTYTITGWKGTKNGVTSTEMFVPSNKKIIL
jgi:hypothetical protein